MRYQAKSGMACAILFQLCLLLSSLPSFAQTPCHPPPSGVYEGRATGGTVWGFPASGYTTDSAIPELAVHAGLLQVGESGILEFKSPGAHAQFVGTNANGVSTLNYSSVWCAMQAARVGGSQPKPRLQASHSPEPLIAGQPFSLTWSSSNASNIALVCTAQGSGFYVALTRCQTHLVLCAPQQKELCSPFLRRLRLGKPGPQQEQPGQA